MGIPWKTYGHEQVKRILDRQIAAGALAHAYLFSGPSGVGKQALAREFAAAILETGQASSHPDFSILDAETAEGGLEEVQAFMQASSFTPLKGKRTVAIINGAQRLSVQSCNALLKTLEEPSPSSIIILVASGRVLPTILSRCVTFYFSPCPPARLKEFASSLQGTVSEQAVAFSFGRPGRLVETLKTGTDACGKSVELLQLLEAEPLAGRLLKIQQLADLEDSEILETLETWTLWQAAQLGARPARAPQVRAIIEAMGKLEKKQNKKLILQQLALTL